MSTENWKRKEMWRRRGDGFAIEISRHEVEARDDSGPHRWAVYAYVYPTHPHFAKFSGNDMWQDAATAMPLHSGPSFLRAHYAEKERVVSYQVGADYNHLHDERFTHCETLPSTVLRDAEELFQWLSDVGAGKQAEEHQ